MDDIQKPLHDLINASTLPDEDKKMFISFLENAPKKDIAEMTKIFTTDPQEIVAFWTTLKQKLIFIKFLDEKVNFSNEVKNDIKKQISEMSVEEFDSFLATLQKVRAGVDVKEEMNSLLKQSKENNETLSLLTKQLITE